MRRLVSLATAIACLVAAGCGGHASWTTPLVRVPLFVPSGLSAPPFDVPRTLVIPSGWGAEVWTRADHARFAAWTPTGELLVSEPVNGDIVRLIPGRNPVAPPLHRVLLSGLTLPQGLAFGRGALYVAEANRVDRFSWPGLRRTAVTPLRGFGPRGLALGPDETAYVTGGGSVVLAGGRTFARGVRNAEGLAVDPDGKLWAAVNAAGESADELVELVGGRVAARRELRPHSAPLGFGFGWRGGALLALHGAGDPASRSRPRIVWLPWSHHTLGQPQTIVAGFRQTWGRPADAVPGPDGSLYVTDDLAGAVYRLTPPS